MTAKRQQVAFVVGLLLLALLLRWAHAGSYFGPIGTGSVGPSGPSGPAGAPVAASCGGSDPANPATGWVLYCKTVGGKAALYVIFPSGIGQQLAIEP